jgi:hypothetical protein
MIKKILSVILVSVSTISMANADMTNVGLKVSVGTLDASGSHTTNSTTSGSLGSGGAAVSAAADETFNYGSIFVERQFERDNFDFALGLDVIPGEREIGKLSGGTGFDATVNIGNVYTAYVQPMIKGPKNITFFAKLGYTQADLDITDIARQSTSAGTASTDGATQKSLEGPMGGLGMQVDAGPVFVRLEATKTYFDEITHTNSNGKILKAESELDSVSFSIGRSF